MGATTPDNGCVNAIELSKVVPRTKKSDNYVFNSLIIVYETDDLRVIQVGISQLNDERIISLDIIIKVG